jgi:hypothetical protein
MAYVISFFQCLGHEGRRGFIEIIVMCRILMFVNRWAAELGFRGPPVEKSLLGEI